MLSFFIFFLLFIVPGCISVLVYKLISRHKISSCCVCLCAAFIFDLLILTIYLAGLYIFKCIHTLDQLNCYFICLSFTSKYAILSIIVGIVIAAIIGLIQRLWLSKKHCGCHHKGYKRESK